MVARAYPAIGCWAAISVSLFSYRTPCYDIVFISIYCELLRTQVLHAASDRYAGLHGMI